MDDFDIGAAVDQSFAEMNDNNGGNGSGVVDTTATELPDDGADGTTELTETDNEQIDQALEQKPDQTTLNTTGEIEVPKTWRKEAAAHWAALPPEVRAEVQKREEDMFRGLEQYKGDAAIGRAMAQVLQPHADLMRQHNVEPGPLINSLLHAQRTLSFGTPQQKAEFVQNLVQQYGIELPDPSQSAYVDPNVQRLQSEVQRLQSSVTAQQQATVQARITEQKTAIDAFAADPKNVHFDAALPDMVVLIEKGVCKTLPEAYERAVWMNPDLRQKEMARQQAEATAQKNAAAAAHAANARKATGANVKTTAKSGSAAAPLGSIDDTLNATLSSILNRT